MKKMYRRAIKEHKKFNKKLNNILRGKKIDKNILSYVKDKIGVATCELDIRNGYLDINLKRTLVTVFYDKEENDVYLGSYIEIYDKNGNFTGSYDTIEK